MLEYLGAHSLYIVLTLDSGHMHKFLSISLSPFPASPSSAWKSHTGYYNCSMYEEKGEDQEVNMARKALEKYLFYYQRVGNEGGREEGREGRKEE